MGGGRGLTDLRDVGSWRDGEGVSIEGEGDIRHALNVLAVHCRLWEEKNYAQSEHWPCSSRILFIALLQISSWSKYQSCTSLFLFESFDVRALHVCLLWLWKKGGKIPDIWNGVMVWLTSPYWLVEAPTHAFMLLMSLVGPTIREVPVSMMAWQPPEQATVCPLMVTLWGGTEPEGGIHSMPFTFAVSILHVIKSSTVLLWVWDAFLRTCPSWSASRLQRSEGPIWFVQCSGCYQRHRRSPHCPAHFGWEIKKTRFTCKFNLKRIAHCEAKDFHPVSVPAQVDGEQRLGHEFLLHHTIEDGHDVVRGNGLEGQTQDAISQHVGHEGSLCLAQSKHLIGHRDAANLDTDDDCQSKLNGPQRYCMPVRSINILSILFQGFCLPQQCHWPDIQSCCQCRTGWTEACCPSGRWTTAVGWISCGSLQENNFSFKFTFHYNTEQLSLSSES